jgi:hypothetical protein
MALMPDSLTRTGRDVAVSVIRDDGQVPQEASASQSGDIPPGELRPTGRPNARLRQTVRDMVLSLVVVLGAIGVILAITWRPSPDPVRVIDPGPVLALARAQASYPVLYPADLDDGWRPTSARWEITPTSTPDQAWHLGLVTPDEDYAQVGQTASGNTAYVMEQVGRSAPTGEWDGWQRYEFSDERALLQVTDGVTIIVSGTAPWQTLEFLAQRLSANAVPPQSGD